VATTDLLSLEEFKLFAGLNPAESDRDYAIEAILGYTTSAIESYLDRKLVTRGSIVEYHTTMYGQCEIYLSQWPAIAVASVYEDSTRSYAASSLLTVNTDYTVTAPRGKLTRISNLVSTTWVAAYRSIKVTYTGGYATTADVPNEIKYQAQRFASIAWGEAAKKTFGLASVSDVSGSISRFVPPGLNELMKAGLYKFRRMEHAPTWEVDA
jgi:hypothetical protein